MTPTVEDIRRALTQLPDLCALLPTALITRRPQSEGRRSQPASRPPVNLNLIDLLDRREKHDWCEGMTYCDPERMGVLPYLDGWARDLEATALDQRPEPPEPIPDEPTITNTCAWLLTELDYATTLPQWPELSEGIWRTYNKVRHAVDDLVEHHNAIPTPLCDNCGLARLVQQRSNGTLWRCPECRKQWTVQAVTIEQAAELLGVPRRTLSYWLQRPAIPKQLWRIPSERKVGEYLYDLTQLADIVSTRRRQNAG